MSVPYRKSPLGKRNAWAAFIDVIWSSSNSKLFGGLLLIDGQGRPVEFAHTQLEAPSGFLWPADTVRRLGTLEVVHTLFETCQREPLLLVCRHGLGDPTFCREEIAPGIPFALASRDDDEPVSWAWLNDAPPRAHPAMALWEELVSHGLLLEPFDRVIKGLAEVYPEIAREITKSP